jgi:hypothetical protein
MARLKFLVKTGDSSLNANDSDIWCRIVDSSGRQSHELLVHHAGDPGLEPGRSMTIIRDVPGNFGPIHGIEVRKSDGLDGSFWHLEKIHAVNIETEDECVFAFNDISLEGELFSSSAGLMHRRTVPAAEVFWCARDLSVFPAQNHHFLAVTFRNRNAACRICPEFIAEKRQGYADSLVTLGGYADGLGTMMQCHFNHPDDAETFSTYVNSGKFFGSWCDMDFQRHRIEPLQGKNEIELAGAVIQAGWNFMMHEKRPAACLETGNCGIFVNSLLASLGYPSRYRKEQGAFWVAKCDEPLIDTSFFSPPAQQSLLHR